MPRLSTSTIRLNPLESRDAPATLVDGSTITYKDTDGDAVTAKLSRPLLTAANAGTIFQFASGTVDGDNSTGQQLQFVSFFTLGVNGLSMAITAEKAGGDGLVDVGYVDAGGVDVGTITISGDLGRISAGDPNSKTQGLKSLSVGSIGVRSLNTQAPNGSLVSGIVGRLSKLSVTSDVMDATIDVAGDIGSIAIGGSLRAINNNTDTGQIHATGSIGTVTIQGDIAGGPADKSGIRADKSIGAVTVDGSLLGGTGTESSSIHALGGNLGPVVIKGDIKGGSGAYSASVQVDARKLPNNPNAYVLGFLKSIVVVGDVIGGTGPYSASIAADCGIGSASVHNLTGNGAHSASIATSSVGTGIRGIGKVTVSGDMTGVDTGSGEVEAVNGGSIGIVTVSGSINGGPGDESGAIRADAISNGVQAHGGRIGSVAVTGGVTGSGGKFSAAIAADIQVGKVVVGGLVGGSGDYSAGILSSARIISVTVNGDVQGGGGVDSAAIVAIEEYAAASIGTVHVTGNVTGGSGKGSGSIISDRKIGHVTVDGNWTGASIAAGISVGADGYFGTIDDREVSFANDRIVPTIGAITIGGTVNGTATPLDNFAFTSIKIGPVTIGGQKQALKPGDQIDLGADGDFELEEG